ncbi:MULTISPECIES: DUF3300 domain-containing protein [Myxococcaceae]|uniref:DUF3300 domain-containing protein n=1 Tax=Myxococcaceae TaxID=31 RepID=UPI001E37B484|nr:MULTISPECIES: DUF3300 domain-containing protein [Myxococcaceae]
MSRDRSPYQRLGVYALTVALAAPGGCADQQKPPPPKTQQPAAQKPSGQQPAAQQQPAQQQPAQQQPTTAQAAPPPQQQPTPAATNGTSPAQPVTNQPGQPAQTQTVQNVPPQGAQGQQPAQGQKTFSQKDLDELLAPIALYPDTLLAQVLMASTYPLEVVEAARWRKANPKLKDKALEDALQKQPWDPSVKSIVAVPQALEMMDQKLDWTQKLGDAFLAQQAEVMATVQKLRAKAEEAGTLKTTEQQKVKTETQEDKTVIVIEQSDPQVVYVPTYNPAVVYGTWWYPAPPPYYYYPVGYAVGVGLAFTTAAFVGAAMWGGVAWGRGSVNVNVNRYNSFNRTSINNSNWNHNVNHRGGVAYRDQGTAQRYNRGSNTQASRSREQFRGRAQSGDFSGAGSRSGNYGGAGSRSGSYGGSGSVGSGSRSGSGSAGSRSGSYGGSGSGGSRSSGSYSGSGSRSGSFSGGGFSGAGGGGSSTRAASSRGSFSRGGGGGRGGGRR